MIIKDWTIVSESRNGRKAMIISPRTVEKKKVSVTRHARRVAGVWTYEQIDEDSGKRTVFEEFLTEEQLKQRQAAEKRKHPKQEEHENDADMAQAFEEGN